MFLHNIYGQLAFGIISTTTPSCTTRVTDRNPHMATATTPLFISSFLHFFISSFGSHHSFVQTQVVHKEGPEVIDEALRLFERWEMASAGHLGPPPDAVKVFGPTPRRSQELPRIRRHRRRNQHCGRFSKAERERAQTKTKTKNKNELAMFF